MAVIIFILVISYKEFAINNFTDSCLNLYYFDEFYYYYYYYYYYLIHY